MTDLRHSQSTAVAVRWAYGSGYAPSAEIANFKLALAILKPAMAVPLG